MSHLEEEDCESLMKVETEEVFVYDDIEGPPLLFHTQNMMDVTENYKDNLLASLYSQIEFLRNEMSEKNIVIRKCFDGDAEGTGRAKENYKDNLLASLYAQIEFLKHEVNEKNNIIRILLRSISNLDHMEKNTHVDTNNYRTDSRSSHKSDDVVNILSDDSGVSHSNVTSRQSSNLSDSRMPHSNGVLIGDFNFDDSLLDLDIMKQSLRGQVRLLNCRSGIERDDEDEDEDEDDEDNVEDNVEELSERTKHFNEERMTLPTAPNYNRKVWEFREKVCESKEMMWRSGEKGRESGDKVWEPGNKVWGFDDDVWEPGTHLIIGDDTILGIKDERLGKRIKVRGYFGARLRDFYDYLKPLLGKRPSFVTIMTCSNDMMDDKCAKQILDEVLDLKKFVEATLPECKVTVSCAPTRFDDDRTKLVTLELRQQLRDLDILQL